MKIALFGGSGRTGQLIARNALEAGHDVRALVRNPANFGIQHPRLDVVRGDLRERTKVAATLIGAGCAISAVGPVRGDPPGVMGVLAANLVDTMTTAGVRRLVYLTGAGMVQPEDPPALATRLMLPLMKLLARDVLDDSTAGVSRIKSSALDWIIIRAPRLSDEPARGTFRTGYIKPKLAALSRADLANFVLAQITSDEYLRKLPIVSY